MEKAIVGQTPTKSPLSRLRTRVEQVLKRIGNVLYKQRYLFLIILLLLGSGGGGWYFMQRQQQGVERQAQEELWPALYYIDRGDQDLALAGDPTTIGLLEIIRQYPRTKAAQQARFYAATIYRARGQQEEAIRLLQAVELHKTFFQGCVWSMIGDIYSEMDQPDQALSWYQKATQHAKDSCWTALFLFKAAAVHECQKQDLQKALGCYAEVCERFPGSPLYAEAKKQRARLHALLQLAAPSGQHV